MAVSKRFLQTIAILILLLCFTYLFLASFIENPVKNKENIASIIGFIINALMLVIGFFFGSSAKQE